MAILEYFVFVGRGYSQHGGYSWRGPHGLHYHYYLILSSYNLNDAVALEYGQALLWSKNLKQVDGKRSREDVCGSSEPKRTKGPEKRGGKMTGLLQEVQILLNIFIERVLLLANRRTSS